MSESFTEAPTSSVGRLCRPQLIAVGFGNPFRVPISTRLFLELLRLGADVVEAALHVEGLLRRSSHLPSTISLKLRTVSLTSTYLPGVPVKVSVNPLFYNLRQRALPQAVNDLPVVVSEIGEEAATIGMVLTAGEELLKARCAELDQQDLTRGTKRQQLRVSARAGQILP